MNNLSIKILKKTDCTKESIKNITQLINSVYEATEGDFWPNDGSYSRTNFDDISNFIQKEELIIAQINKTIVGTVHIYPIDDKTLGFGMLSCALEHRKKGIGNLLLKEVEDFAKKNQYKIIQLELLKPLHFNHPDKEFLTIWYQKWGYRWFKTIPHEKLYFKQASMLKFPCKFELFQKVL